MIGDSVCIRSIMFILANWASQGKLRLSHRLLDACGGMMTSGRGSPRDWGIGV
jgi:hypothetical protein